MRVWDEHGTELGKTTWTERTQLEQTASYHCHRHPGQKLTRACRIPTVTWELCKLAVPCVHVLIVLVCWASSVDKGNPPSRFTQEYPKSVAYLSHLLSQLIINNTSLYFLCVCSFILHVFFLSLDFMDDKMYGHSTYGQQPPFPLLINRISTCSNLELLQSLIWTVPNRHTLLKWSRTLPKARSMALKRMEWPAKTWKHTWVTLDNGDYLCFTSQLRYRYLSIVHTLQGLESSLCT